MSTNNNFLWLSVFAVSAMLVNSIGIYAIYLNEKWAQRAKNYMMCFAAGLLISSPLIFAFPAAVAKNEHAGFSALVGFLFMFFSNKIINDFTDDRNLAFGLTAVEGIAIHSFVDGVIYSVTFSVNLMVGLASALGLVIHEFAEGMITFSLLLKGGVSRSRAKVFAFFLAALTTPIGAFISYPLISRLSSSVLGLVLGFVVGVLIYISASHLLPEAQHHDEKHSTLAFLSGVCVAILMIFFKHNH